MGIRSLRVVLVLMLMLIAAASLAGTQPLGYRWVDEQGSVHYAGRRDQVPERYRGQLPREQPGEPPRPQVGPVARGDRPPVPGECVLRFRGTERRRGSSRFYPSCEACRKALAAMRGEDSHRAECIAASVESYR
jgi:hypothetical protein